MVNEHIDAGFHALDRMDDDGGHLNHAERVKVLKRRFVKAAIEFVKEYESQEPLDTLPVFLAAYHAWHRER